MKKYKILLSLLCAILIVSMSAFSFSAVAAEDEVSKKVDEIVEEVLSGPERYDFEDIIYVFENDGAAAREILNYLDEVSIPAESTVSRSSLSGASTMSTASISVPTGNAVEYDVVTKKETISYAADLPSVEESEEEEEVLSDPLSDDFPGMIFPNPFSEFSVNANIPTDGGGISNSIFKLYSFSQGSSTPSHGTGFRISNNYIATAGHVIYDYSARKWATNVLCVPYNEINKTDPVESYVVNSNMAVGQSWYDDGNKFDDWGVVQMRNPMTTGIVTKRHIGYPSLLSGETVRITGFNGTSKALSTDTGTVMLYGEVQTAAMANYYCVKGQSGGPVTDIQGRVVGIHHGTHEQSSAVFVTMYPALYNRFINYS